MSSNSSSIPVIVEATVTSKGQVTLPKAIRSRLGIDTGTRIRFSMSAQGGFQADKVLYELEDLWKRADQGGKAAHAMSLEEMNQAKYRRKW